MKPASMSWSQALPALLHFACLGLTLTVAEAAKRGPAANSIRLSGTSGPAERHANSTAQPRFFLAACAQFKNEDTILREWLEHYMKEGVQHFYLIDDGSTDASHQVLAPYASRGLITLMVDDRKRHEPPITMVERYNILFKPFFYSTTWMLHVDLDEFMYGRAQPIATYLKRVSPEVGCISVPWKHFGSSRHVQKPKKGIVQSFLWRDRHPKGTLGKSVFRTAAVKSIDMHWEFLKPDFQTGYPLQNGRMGSQSAFAESTKDLDGEQLLNQLAIHLNHYRVRWKEWYVSVKMTRGIADRETSVYDDAYFRRFDFHEIRDDELAKRSAKRQTLRLPP